MNAYKRHKLATDNANTLMWRHTETAYLVFDYAGKPEEFKTLSGAIQRKRSLEDGEIWKVTHETTETTTTERIK